MLHYSVRVPNKYVVVSYWRNRVVTGHRGNVKKIEPSDNHERAPELVYSVFVGPLQKRTNERIGDENPSNGTRSVEKVDDRREFLNVSHEDVCPRGSALVVVFG